MVKKIAVVGVGGIGRRHVESFFLREQNVKCCVDAYDIDLGKLDEIRCSIKECLFEGVELRCFNSFDYGEKIYDVVIIATPSDVRKSVLFDFFKQKKAKYLILEKVLFQYLNDYIEVEQFLDENNLVTYVNCNLRTTPLYREFKKNILSEEKIEKMVVSGASWGIACNTIHFIDLFSYLVDSTDLSSINSNMIDIFDAKRKGFKDFFGSVSGGIGKSKFYFEATPGDFNLEIKIKTNKNEYLIRDMGREVEFSNLSDTSYINKRIEVPYQSEMTATVVLDLINKDNCTLPCFSISSRFHVKMLDSFMLGFSTKKDINKCPIT